MAPFSTCGWEHCKAMLGGRQYLSRDVAFIGRVTRFHINVATISRKPRRACWPFSRVWHPTALSLTSLGTIDPKQIVPAGKFATHHEPPRN